MGNWCTSRENGKTKIKVTYQSVNITLVQGTFLDVETTCFINAAVNPLVATVRTQLQSKNQVQLKAKPENKPADQASKPQDQQQQQQASDSKQGEQVQTQSQEQPSEVPVHKEEIKQEDRLPEPILLDSQVIQEPLQNQYVILHYKVPQDADVFSILPNILNSAFTSAETSNYIHVGIPEELFKLVTNKTPQEVASLSLSTVTSYIDSRGADLKLKDIKITIHTDELFKAFEDEFAKLSGDKKQQQPELKQQQVQKPEQEVLPNAEKVPEDQQPDVQKLPDELKQQPEPDHQQQQQQQQPQDVHQADQQP